MGNAALRLVDEDFTDYGDGDDEGGMMCCPDCGGTDFKLIDDEYHTVMCSECGAIVDIEWLEGCDIVDYGDEDDEELEREMRDIYDSLGIDHE